MEGAFGRRGHKLDDLEDRVLGVGKMVLPEGVGVPRLPYRAEERRSEVGEFMFEGRKNAVRGGCVWFGGGRRFSELIGDLVGFGGLFLAKEGK